MKLTKREYILLCIFGVLLIWYIWHKYDKKKDQQTSSTILAPGVVEKIVVNPQKHTLEVVTPNQDHTVTLPDRPSSIEIHKDNSVVVTSPQFGTEHHFFAGFLAADTLRIGCGVDGVYFKKWDVGLGLAGQPGNHTPIAFAKVSYNFYGGLQFGVYYGTNSIPGAVLTVRFF